MRYQMNLRIMRFAIYIFVVTIFAACSPSESAIQTAIAETAAAEPTFTVTVVTPTITASQTPSPTNSSTPTLTNTATFTLTPSKTNTATFTLTPSKTNTPTNTPLLPEEITQTAISENVTGTAESIQATQTAKAAQATSTRRAYESNLTATAAARPSTLTFMEIENSYYDMEDDPWNNYRASSKGVRVQWTGRILDTVFDTLLLDMGQYRPDRMIALHKVPTITVEKLKIGDTVTFIAVITDVTFYCDVQLNLIEMK
jgi:hypothetical protein